MKQLAWLTDIHLEMLPPEKATAFFESIRDSNADAILLGGDIATAGTLALILLQMQKIISRPIYFVLGNHDYYGGDIDAVRNAARLLTEQQPHLFWLPATGPVELSPTTALVGHGGWSDGGYGDFMASEIMLQDYLHIASLKTDDRAERFTRLARLGHDAAHTLRPQLKSAIEHYKNIYILTHSPPFVEACWYQGKTPTLQDAYLPHFTCKALGDLILEVASAHPQTTFTVLCGHTHGSGTANLLPNLTVITGGAEYEKPVIQQIIEVG